jgi:hypothetical protein
VFGGAAPVVSRVLGEVPLSPDSLFKY